MHTHPLLLCAYCMCGCIGLVSQLSSFAALVKRGATLIRRETDSVSAAPDRVWGGLLWMKLVQFAWCASVERWKTLVTPVFGTLYTHVYSLVFSHSSRFHCCNILQAFISGMYDTTKNAVGETA